MTNRYTSTRLHSLMEALYSGPNWVSVDIVSTVTSLTAAQAATRILPHSNTIWEIVNHMTGWRDHVLRWLRGEEFPSPEHNYIQKVDDTSEDAWKKTLNALENSQRSWLEFLNGLQDNDLDRVYAPSKTSHYVLIEGIIQHDYYHLGQIKMLVKYV